MKVEFSIGSSERAVGEVVKENPRTVWVKYKNRIIKRHKEKHFVEEVISKEGRNERV